MYKGDGAVSEETSDEAEHPLTATHQESDATYKLKPMPCPTSDLTFSVQTPSLTQLTVRATAEQLSRDLAGDPKYIYKHK